jgi:hypothetical protein
LKSIVVGRPLSKFGSQGALNPKTAELGRPISENGRIKCGGKLPKGKNAFFLTIEPCL